MEAPLSWIPCIHSLTDLIDRFVGLEHKRVLSTFPSASLCAASCISCTICRSHLASIVWRSWFSLPLRTTCASFSSIDSRCQPYSRTESTRTYRERTPGDYATYWCSSCRWRWSIRSRQAQLRLQHQHQYHHQPLAPLQAQCMFHELRLQLLRSSMNTRTR